MLKSSLDLMARNSCPGLPLVRKNAILLHYRVYATASFFFDLMKCRAQTTVTKTMSYREEVTRILRTEGLLGFQVGYRAMIGRDIISFGCYFLFYDRAKHYLSPSDPSQPLPIASKMLAGACAGASSWFLGFPLDSLKVRAQTGASPDGIIRGLI
jgi:hypothetical protein